MTSILGSIFWLIITLGVLVTFHELGHFWVARLFKVKVLRFCVGFGKPIWSRLDKQGTEIAVAPIPLGGYVKLLDTRDCDVEASDMDKTYNQKPIWQKFLIMFAGPAFNFILAFILYWLMFVVGKDEIQPTLSTPTQIMQSSGFQNKDKIKSVDGEQIRTWSDVSLHLITAGIDRRDINIEVETDSGTRINRQLALSKVPSDVSEEALLEYIGLKPYRLPAPAVLDQLDEKLPAAQSGMQKDDVIVKINQQNVADWYDVTQIISAIKSGPVVVEVLREGELKTFTVPHLMPDPENADRKVLGIRSYPPSEQDIAYYRSLFYTLSYGPVESVSQAVKQINKITVKSLEMMWKLVSGKASLKNLSGPITIAKVANDSASRGFSWYLSFLALVSLSLGIINLLPVPMLDGGQMLFLVFEKIKGSPLSEQFELKAQFIGMFLLISLMSLAFYNDILRSVS